MSKSKTYCPNPPCSIFISDLALERMNSKSRPITLQECLSKILIKLQGSESARFFRDEVDITELAANTPIPADPIHLAYMEVKLNQYQSVEELTQDVQRIVSNAHLYGADHPIAQAANELFALCLHELSDVIKEHFLDRSSSFACPACRVVICAKCKEVAHPGNECDDTARDQEMAMLAKFGYKQCPRCGQGVRKMYGCSHV